MLMDTMQDEKSFFFPTSDAETFSSVSFEKDEIMKRWFLFKKKNPKQLTTIRFLADIIISGTVKRAICNFHHCQVKIAMFLAYMLISAALVMEKNVNRHLNYSYHES